MSMKNYDDPIGNRNSDLQKRKVKGLPYKPDVLVRTVLKCIVLLKRVCDKNMKNAPNGASSN